MRLLRWSVLLTVLLLAAGCQTESAPAAPANEPNAGQHGNDGAQGADSPQKTYLEDSSETAAADWPDSSSANDEDNDIGETSALHNDDHSKAVVNAESEDQPWIADMPKLGGIAIGDTETEVYSLFGDSSDNYSLDEEDESITVHEYDGFAVGFNKARTVQFVEVYGEHTATGLSGLRIGDNAQSAIDALGKPTTQTTYLLAYEAEGALLKLDLDPEQDRIVSIKLIGQA